VLDSVLDHRVDAMQEKIAQARLESQARAIAEAEGMMFLQRGVDLPSLDVTYCTSLSFYILLLFGLRGAFMLAFREGGVIDEASMQRMSMGMGGAGGAAAAATDPAKAFEAEQAAVSALAWDAPRLDGAESAACEALKKFLSSPSSVVERES
jgi:hypothetical protein